MPKRTTFKKYNATQEEPMLSSENPETQIIEALNWYNYNKTKDDAKKYFLEYLEKHVDHKNVTTISSLDSVSVNNNIGWLCRIFMTNPTTFPQKYIKNIEEAKDKVLQVVVENEPQEPELTLIKKTSVQENIQKQLGIFLGEIDEQLDWFVQNKCVSTFSISEWLKTNSIKHFQAKNIADHYESLLLKELIEAKDGTCEQLKEAYSFLTPQQLDSYITFLQTIISECELWEATAKQVALNNRAPRVKKPKPATKQVAKLNFLKEDGDLKSIDPTKIVGATQLCAYNTKTRLLSFYVCTNPHGFSVRGSTLLNFDEAESFGKVLRKPSEILPKILDAGKLSLKKTVVSIKTKQKQLTGRINKDTLLIKAL